MSVRLLNDLFHYDFSLLGRKLWYFGVLFLHNVGLDKKRKKPKYQSLGAKNVENEEKSRMNEVNGNETE
jgi:hypothetical protein